MKPLLCFAFMLWNKRLVWPNQDWHHWQQLRAACTVCLCTCVPVVVCLRLCVRVFVSVKTRWPDCSAEQWGKIQPCVVRVPPMKNMRNGPQCTRLTAPPSHCSCVLCMSDAPPTPPHTLSGTPDNAKADLEMKNDPPLAVYCSINAQLQWLSQILSRCPSSLGLLRCSEDLSLFQISSDQLLLRALTFYYIWEKRGRRERNCTTWTRGYF